MLCVLLAVDVPGDHPAIRHFFRWLGPQLVSATGQTQLICLHALKDMLKNKDLHIAFEQEQVMHDIVRAKLGHREPACVEVASLAERDHLLGIRLDRLRLRLGRLDPAMLNQRACEIGVQRLAMG